MLYRKLLRGLKLGHVIKKPGEIDACVCQCRKDPPENPVGARKALKQSIGLVEGHYADELFEILLGSHQQRHHDQPRTGHIEERKALGHLRLFRRLKICAL